MHVFALSDHSNYLLEPNTLDSLSAIGLAEDSGYCTSNFDTGDLAPSYTFGTFHMHNLVSDINILGVNPFIIYNSPSAVTKVNWGNLDYGSSATDGSVYYVGISSGVLFSLYACGTAGTTKKCLQSLTPGGASSRPYNGINISAIGSADSKAQMLAAISYPSA